MDPTGYFPHANELLIEGFNGGSSHHELSKSRKRMSPFVPWSLLTKIVIDGSYFISAAELEAVLRMSYKIHTLQIKEDNGSLCRAILFDTANLATRINQQVIISILIKEISLKLIPLFFLSISNFKRIFFLK
jgi:hypothetical protein